MRGKFALTLLFFGISVLLNAYAPHFITDPALSPDGTTVCFSYHGDLWLVPFTGGTASRLTSTSASEFGPCWSPDGKSIAFTSNREGSSYVYVIPSSGGTARPVYKSRMTVCDWFTDGKFLLCSKNNLNWGTSLYKVPLDGSAPVLISEIGDYFSCLTKDNNSIIFNRYGDAYRPAYRGSANGDLWSYDISKQTYTRLTSTDYTERYPRVSDVTNEIYFCASDGSRYQIFRTVNQSFEHCEQLTDFSIWSVRDISLARQNDRIVYELFDAIWCYDPDREEGTKAFKLTVQIEEDDWPDLIKEETLADNFDKFAVSDDEALVAFSYKYDLFVMPRKGGEVKQITFDQFGIENIAFLPDNRTIVFSRYKNGLSALFKTKVDSLFTIEEIPWYGKDSCNVDNFYSSSDWHWVIEYTNNEGGGKIAIADSVFNNIIPVLTDKVICTNFACSPDGKTAIFATLRNDIYVRELYLLDISTGERRNITNTDAWLDSFTWTPDQKSILFGSNKSGRSICRLDLIPRNSLELEKDNWKEILSPSSTRVAQDSTKTAKQTSKTSAISEVKQEKLTFAQVNWDRIDKRIIPILTDTDFLYPVKAIDDTSFYYVKSVRGKDAKLSLAQVNIYGRYSSEIGSFPADTDFQFTDKNGFYFKDGSKLRAFNLTSKTKAEINNSFNYNYNLKTLNMNVFKQVWGIFGRNFYDPTMHNTDWNALYKQFEPYLQYADNSAVLETLIDEMIGKVNASHTGYYPRRDNPLPNKEIAYLGLEFDQRNLLPRGMLISKVYSASALYDFYGIREGDILYSVNGYILTPQTPLDSLLTNKVNKKLDLVFKRGNKAIFASVKGLSWSQNREIWFNDKVERKRLTTEVLSEGNVGYVYIPRMNGEEYNNFISDVFSRNADKKALIIDIRGNEGGHIHNDLLDFLTRKPNALTSSRKFGAVRQLTPGRTWNKPVVLLIDENSFSDAEIFPHLFKEAKLGTIIGMPTSGSVIGTWQVKLIDGSTMRMPGSGWYCLDGTNMEGNGVQPDIRVELSLNDLVADNDLQLKQAVSILREQIK
ncbi:MAG: S41 family peptidase [Candidatus Cloacimonadaceae bacterium]